MKRFGRTIKMRPDWDAMKLDAMEQILRLKFGNPILRQFLNETKPHKLVEGNNWGDRFWGVCEGTGENHLGKLLMKIRDE